MPNCIARRRNSVRRPCETTSPLPLDPSPRLRSCRIEDRVPPGTLRRLLLPSPSLPQSVFDRLWFVGRPIERQRHSTPTEARISIDSLSYRGTNWFPARLLRFLIESTPCVQRQAQS